MSKGGSTGNLKRHLIKSHPDKIDPSTINQAEFMKKFIQKGNPQMVNIRNSFVILSNS